MVSIASISLPEKKNIKVALVSSIFGIGNSQALRILQTWNIDPQKKTNQLTDQEINDINKEVRKMLTGGELQQVIIRNIREQISIGSYKGLRRAKNMKINGHSTRRNNRNRPTSNINIFYKERITVANKKRSTDKT